MASNSELYLMTRLVNLSGVKVIDYRIIEGIGIILSLENTHKQVVCPACGQTTDLLHQHGDWTSCLRSSVPRLQMATFST